MSIQEGLIKLINHMKMNFFVLLLIFNLSCFSTTHLKTPDLTFDKGIGFIMLNSSEPCNIYTDTLMTVLKDRLVKKNYVFDFLENNEADVILSNKFEYGYEKFGLPIIDTANNWIKVLLPKNEHFFEYGYVNLDISEIEVVYWAEMLTKVPLFFTNDSIKILYTWIEGEQIKIDSNVFNDYVLYPLHVEGNWMKVKLITPSEECELVSEGKIINGWIKYLQDNGRPNVWYFPRGC